MPARGRGGKFIERLAEEWQARRHSPVSTLYLGGGTPSQLPAGSLGRILALFDGENPVETTIEVNPEDVTDEFARWLASSPVNRVSMGVQSTDDSLLRLIGRRHDAAGAMRAFERLRRAGIGNISLDLIYGLPGQTQESWRRSVADLLALEPEHLSAYLLSYEPGTRLTVMRDAGRVAEADEATAAEMYRHLCEATARRGMEHYEISNFAYPGHRSRHNSSYWNMTPYIGLGPGAHSFIGGVRGSNPPSLARYLARGWSAAYYQPEEESDAERYNDLIITALRTADGLDPALTGSHAESFRRLAAPLIASGQLVVTPAGRLRIPEAEWLVADRIMLSLIDA